MSNSTPIVWIASYPKTGSTWLREIVSNMVDPDSSTRKDTIPSYQKEWPDNLVARPLAMGDCALVKTHLFPGNPRMARIDVDTRAAITITRHPFDILLSSLNYALVKGKEELFIDGVARPVEEIIESGELDHYIDDFAKSDGFPWFAGPSGEFSTYQQKWREGMQGKPYLELVYEDMFADPETASKQIAEFLFTDPSTIDVGKVLKTSDEKTKANGKFFWKRRSYNFVELVPEAQIRHFEDVCGYQLEAAGYAKHLA